jgi:predicted NBD/HSP70 family sugar kinase
MTRGKLTGSNRETAAVWNRSLALRLLRQHGTLSRRQIAQMTGLRGSTLTYIVRDLDELDALRTVGKLPSRSVGQKQILLSINPDMGYTLGLSLRRGTVQALAVDAAGERVAETALEVNGPLEDVPAQVRAALRQWLDARGAPTGRLLGIGAGVPGAIDTDSGLVLHSTSLEADNVPLGRLLAEQFECPVVVDHDARLAAIAEADSGAARGASHFLLFLINPRWEPPHLHLRAYGSALFLDGRLYRGAHSSAGEMDELLAPRRDLVGDAGDLAALTHADAPLTPVLEGLGRAVARTLSSLVNFVDVQRVVLGGTFGLANGALLELIRAEALRHLIAGPDRQLQIVPSLTGAEAVARGAAIAAFNAALDGGHLLAGHPAASAAGD